MTRTCGQARGSGFTLVEMAVATLSGAVLALATLMFLANQQNGFNDVYDSAFCAAADARIAARGAFQRTIRMASAGSGAVLADDGSWVEVYYYSGTDVASPDRTAQFYLSDEDLMLYKTVTDTAETVSLETVCGHVASLRFSRTGDAVRMALELDDGSTSRTLNTSAMMRGP